jgi:hypothetical protein
MAETSRSAVWKILTDISEELNCLQHHGDDLLTTLMMAAINSSETSLHTYQTTSRRISQHNRFHSRHRENLKSHET